MDQTLLVVDDILGGAEFIRRLHQHFPVRAAFWMRYSEDSGRCLHVVLEGLTEESTSAANDEVFRLVQKMMQYRIDPFRIKLLRPDTPMARAALEIYRQHEGRPLPRDVGGWLGDTPAVESYLYPLPGSGN